MEPPNDTASLRAQVANLQAELDTLRARYDTLLEVNNRAAERYKADYKKWRDFKEWLFDAETDDRVKSFLSSRESLAYTRGSALGKRKQSEECPPILGHAKRDDHKARDHQQQSTHEVKVEHSHSPLARVASRRQRPKSYHGGSSRSILSPSPGKNKDLLPAPQSTGHDGRSPVVVNNTKLPCKAEPSRSTPLTEPRTRRGRYAQVPPGMDTINSRFSIRKDKNDGVDFQYDAVVRNRKERKHMLGSDCECCQEYYAAVGPLPPPQQPLWRTPTKCKTSYHIHTSNNDKENTDEVEEHKRMISRHRHHWHRPKTPPGYWNIGFPDTQEVLDINQRATEMHRRKLVEVEAEAKNDKGRYVERAPRTP